MTNTPTPPPRLVPDRPSDAFRVVPLEPTPEMIEAAERREDDEPLSDWGKVVHTSHAEIYKAMLAAAPPAEAPAERGGIASIVECVLHKTYMESADYRVTTTLLHDMARDVAAALTQLAPAPAAPAEGRPTNAPMTGDWYWLPDGDLFHSMNTMNGAHFGRYYRDDDRGWEPDEIIAKSEKLTSTAPRVTGGREWDDAAVERAARFICVTLGEDWDSIGDFARSVLIENQRAALQAATGGGEE